MNANADNFTVQEFFKAIESNDSKSVIECFRNATECGCQRPLMTAIDDYALHLIRQSDHNLRISLPRILSLSAQLFDFCNENDIKTSISY